MPNTHNQLPTIDLDLGTKLAGNNIKFAKEMLALLAKNLPRDLSEISDMFEQKDYPKLLSYIHKLHGALCYCGAPRLREITSQLESVLKKNQLSEVSELVMHLQTEAQLVLDEVAHW